MRVTGLKPLVGKNVGIVFLLGFCLNFTWELLHTPLYSSLPPSEISKVAICSLATIADAAYITLLFLALNRFSCGKTARVSLMALAGVVTAVCVELAAQSLGVWRYSDLMPVVPVLRSGVSPSLQLAATSLAVDGLVR